MGTKFSRHKVSRRFGTDIYGTGGPALERRINVPPGGLRPKRGRESDYGRQLREKQKVKFIYGVREKQFLRYIEMALHTEEPAGRALLQLLERRIDNIVYRLGFARTRLMARQLVSHGHVRVDTRLVDKPSYLVTPGQTITLSSVALKNPAVQFEMETRKPAVSWLVRENGTGKITALPDRDEIEAEIDESLVVAFYSR